MKPSKKKQLEVLNMVIEDCETDVIEFDGREFNGRTLGELHGILEAKIATIAKILKELVKDNLATNLPEEKKDD